MHERTEQHRARTGGLVIKSVGDELLVYDLVSHRAHSLNPTAAAVWQACDGTRNVSALGAASGSPTKPLAPEVVRYALQGLGKANLLEGGPALEERGLTRRQVLASLGLAAAVTLPIVTTIVAPTPAAAASCKNLLEPCSTNEECCGLGCEFSVTSGCSCNLFKTLGKRCLQLTPQFEG